MKYIAIVDDNVLSNFRVDKNVTTNDMVLVVNDEKGFSRGLPIKPLYTETLVTKDGDSVYLRQEHIKCLIEMEGKEMMQRAIKDMCDNLGFEEDAKC